MPRVASLLLSGSTRLTRRTILTLNIPIVPLGLARTTPTTTSTQCVQTSNHPIYGSLQYRCLCQITPRACQLAHPHPYYYTSTRYYSSSSSTTSAVMAALKAKKCVVIGISGVTNGGKTTLCEKLERDLPKATHINMDHYFHDSDSGHIPMVQELNHGNYEDIRAIDFDQMVKDVDAWVLEAANKPMDEQPQILFLEGILIFNHKSLVPYYSLKYFLTLTKEQCWDRRKHRKYDPPDPPNYFDLVVWPMYLKNKSQLQDQKDIVYLDGMEDRDETYKRVLADLKAKLEET